MKTLVVLFAVATASLAAPAQKEIFGTSGIISAPINQLHPIKRESISTNDEISKAALPIEDKNTHLEAEAAPEMSARTFKKGIVIKRKHGFNRLYRASEEERDTSSNESCMKEVKVKLCDAGNPKLTTKGFKRTIGNVEIESNDMEESLKMAKEAVEHLQRDMKSKQHQQGDKLGQWKHKDSIADAEMHADLEVARRALEHVQKNFGHLESMSLRSTTLKDAEAIDDVHKKLNLADTDEARMTQWKEAMEGIQKNIAVARGIENDFKSELHQIHENENILSELPQPHGTIQKSVEDMKVPVPKEHSDMTVSASENNESLLQLHNSEIQGKSSKDDSALKSQEKPAKPQDLSFTVQSNALETKTNAELKAKNSESNMTPAEAIHEKQVLSETFNGNMHMKASEHNENLLSMNLKKANLLKSAENKDLKMEPENSALLKHTGFGMNNADNTMKHQQNFVKFNTNARMEGENIHRNDKTKTLDQVAHQSEQMNVQVIPPFMKAAEESNKFHAAKSAEDFENKESNNFAVTAPSIHKTVLQFKSANTDSAMEMRNNPMIPMEMNHAAEIEKSAVEHKVWKEDARGAYGSYGPAASILSGAAGSIAISGASGPAGAVGVFPSAKVGGCAIPLLLSCSPSVVSGSLAKTPTYAAPSSYAAPSAYRTGEKFKFHNKREIIKNAKITDMKFKRTPMQPVQKYLAIKTL